MASPTKYLLSLDLGSSFEADLLSLTFMLEDTGLLHLPNETIFMIFKFLNLSDLYQLALTSRRLHYIALSICITRERNYDISTGELVLFDDLDRVFPLLKAMRMTLFQPHLKRLTCIFGHTMTCRGALVNYQVKNLHRLMKKLTFVDEVIIDLGPLSWMLTCGMLVCGIQDRPTPARWAETLIPLFTDIVEKSTTFTVRFGESSQKSSTPDIKTRIAERRNQRYLSPRLPTALKKFLGTGVVAYHRRHGDYFTNPNLRPAIKTFCIGSATLLHPLLCIWTIETLNTSSITNLTFQGLDIGPRIWAAFLPCLALPVVSEITIPFCDIAPTDLETFLSRHPTITILNLIPSTIDMWHDKYSYTSHHRRKPFLSRRSTMFNADTVTPSRFKSSRTPTTLPNLRSLSITTPLSLQEPCYPSGTFGYFKDALALVSHRIDDIILSLNVTVIRPTEHLLPLNIDEHMPEDVQGLPHITRLELQADRSSVGLIDDDFWIDLQRLLASFPALEYLSFVDFFPSSRQAGVVNPNTKVSVIVGLLHEAYPNIHIVAINEEERNVRDWLEVDQ